VLSRAVGNLGILAWVIGTMWVLELLDQVVFGTRLDLAGIRPRDVDQWWAILTAPFLHGGFAHLLANTIPLLVLGWLVLLRGVTVFIGVSLCAIVCSGVGVWLFGQPNSIHIGASGLVFGYLGYLLVRGYVERSLLAIAIAVAVGLLYGGALAGVLPGQPGVSWEGHLFGFLGGALAARLQPTSPARPSSGRYPGRWRNAPGL
jgi:membrane associated rhomboid family serine protease